MKHVVKRKGHTEPYDEKKLYGSVYASALNAHHDEGTAEEMGDRVVDYMEQWLAGRHEVKSTELRRQTKKVLDEIDKDVAQLYAEFMDIC
jgi:transcriptional regulator NrdR family protein